MPSQAVHRAIRSTGSRLILVAATLVAAQASAKPTRGFLSFGAGPDFRQDPRRNESGGVVAALTLEGGVMLASGTRVALEVTVTDEKDRLLSRFYGLSFGKTWPTGATLTGGAGVGYERSTIEYEDFDYFTGGVFGDASVAPLRNDDGSLAIFARLQVLMPHSEVGQSAALLFPELFVGLRGEGRF